jgi:hypothetical protein
MTIATPVSGNEPALPEATARRPLCAMEVDFLERAESATFEAQGDFIVLTAKLRRQQQGVSAPSPRPNMRRVSFEVDVEKLHLLQEALFDAPRRLVQLENYMKLLRDLATSEDFMQEYGPGDPRFASAFDMASEGVRAMILREGAMFGELFDLIDAEQNIRKVA